MALSRFRTLLRSPLLTSCQRRYSSNSLIVDPAHPHGLYYHALPNSSYALSFLPTLTHPDSVTVIGYSPQANLDRVNKFEEASNWRSILHMILAGRVHESTLLSTMAKTRAADGFVHLVDERNLPPVNRAGEPEDIIASILVQDRKLVEGSYEPMPAYRVVTTDGMMQLNQELHKHLVAGLEIAQQMEQEETSAQ